MSPLSSAVVFTSPPRPADADPSMVTGLHPIFTAEGARAAAWLSVAGEEMRRLREAGRRWAAQAIQRQVSEAGPDQGALMEDETGYLCGRHTGFQVPRLVAAMLALPAEAAEALEWERAILAAVGFLRRRVSPRGWLDLGGRHSPNEMGFVLSGLAAAWEALGRGPGSVRRAAIRAGLEELCLRGAEGVLAGEAFTANHRWAAAAGPLAAVHRRWPDPRYLAKIESYLADGIDNDETGCWFEERSPNYNNIANEGVLLLARHLGRPELLAPVVRSGKFILDYVQPNGEADTSFSFRQDRGRAGCPPMSYPVARALALITGDGRYTTLAAGVFAQAPGSGLEPVLLTAQEEPGPLPMPQPLGPEPVRRDPAGRLRLARRREGATALTLAADTGGHFFDTVLDQWGRPRHSEDWLHLHHGDVVLQSLQLAVAGTACVQPRELLALGDERFLLRGRVEGTVHPQHFRPGAPEVEMRWGLEHEIDLSWRRNGLDLELRAVCPDSLIASLIFWVRPGVVLRGARAGASDQRLRAGDQIDLEGPGFSLIGMSGVLAVRGLGPAAHRARVGSSPAIPSVNAAECAALRFGLRLPVSLALHLELGAAERSVEAAWEVSPD